MTDDELEHAVIDTLRQIAATAASKLNPENPGGAMLAILITTYATVVGDFLQEGVITLEQGQAGVRADFDVIERKLQERFG